MHYWSSFSLSSTCSPASWIFFINEYNAMMAIVIWGHIYLSSYVLVYFLSYSIFTLLKDRDSLYSWFKQDYTSFINFTWIFYSLLTPPMMNLGEVFVFRQGTVEYPKPLNMGLWFFVHWVHATDWWSVWLSLYWISISLSVQASSTGATLDTALPRNTFLQILLDNRTWEDYLKFT